MRGSTKLILILVLLFGVLFSLAMLTTGNHAIDTIASQANQQQTAVDIVLQSRQTAPAAPPAARNGWLGTMLLMLFLVVSGVAVALMWRGEKFIKAWRLLRKKQQQPLQHIPYAPYGEYPSNVPTITNARRVPLLEDQSYEQDDFNHSY